MDGQDEEAQVQEARAVLQSEHASFQQRVSEASHEFHSTRDELELAMTNCRRKESPRESSSASIRAQAPSSSHKKRAVELQQLRH